MANEVRIIEVQVRSTGEAALVRLQQEVEKLAQSYDKANRATLKMNDAQARVDKTMRQSRQQLVGLGQQLQDSVIQLQAGTAATTVFVQQGSQLAFQLQNAGGAIGTVARVLAGPWGLAVFGAVAVLGALIKELDLTAERNKELQKEFGLTAKEVEDFKNRNITATDYIVGAWQQAVEQFELVRDGISFVKKAFELLGDYLQFLWSRIVRPLFVGWVTYLRMIAGLIGETGEQVAYFAGGAKGARPTFDVQSPVELYKNTESELTKFFAGSQQKAEARWRKRAQAEADAIIAARKTTVEKVKKSTEEIMEAMVPILQGTGRNFYDTLVKLSATDFTGLPSTDTGYQKVLEERMKLQEDRSRLEYLLAEAENLGLLPGEVRKLQEAYAGVRMEMEELNLTALESQGLQLAVKAIQEMGTAFSSAIEGAESFSDAFESMAKTLVRELVKIIAQLLILEALKAVFGNNSFVQAVTGALGFKDGGVLDKGVKKFAQGGVVNGPTLFGMRGGLGVMGEAGPEAIMPLRRGANGQLGVGAPPVNVQVINNAGAQVSVEDRGGGELAIFIDAAKREIASDIARGGGLVSRSIENAYGASRARR